MIPYCSINQSIPRILPSYHLHHLATTSPAVFRKMASTTGLDPSSRPSAPSSATGDLNNQSALRATSSPLVDQGYAYKSLAISQKEDDPRIRRAYRPFVLSDIVTCEDWISKVELSTVTKMAEEDLKRTGQRIKILVLTGSLRKR